MNEKSKRTYYQDSKNIIVAILEATPRRAFSTHSLEKALFALSDPGRRVGHLHNMLTELVNDGLIVRVKTGWYRAVMSLGNSRYFDPKDYTLEYSEKMGFFCSQKLNRCEQKLDQIQADFEESLDRIVTIAKGQVGIAISLALPDE